MKDSQKQTARSSVSSRPTQTKPRKSRLPVIALLVVNVVVIGLVMYLLQEGLAHLRQPNIVYFVEFPTWVTYLVGAAGILTIPNLAIGVLSLRRALPVRRWTLVSTALAVILTAVAVVVIGVDDVLTIINPNW